MNQGKLVFSQLMAFLPLSTFRRCVATHRGDPQPGMEDSLRFEQRHQEIIHRFGRYPHRNALLGRTSTAGELAFLSEPGSSF